MTSWWPIFDVEVRTPRLLLNGLTDQMIPGLLEAIHSGVHPAGVDTGSFPPTHLTGTALERSCVLTWWAARVNWKPNQWHFDAVVFERDRPETPIGIQSIGATDFATERTASTMSWLSRSKHRQGIGTEMRHAALAFAFHGLNANKVISAAEPSNLASRGVSLACGYEPSGTQTIVTDSGKLLLDRFEITVDRWRQLDRPAIEIENLDGALREFVQP